MSRNPSSWIEDEPRPSPVYPEKEQRETLNRSFKDAADLAVEELRRIIGASPLSQRQIELRVGFSKGYLSQLLAHNLDLKVWHVLAILDALGENPGDFFSRVYPRRSEFPALERFRESSLPLTEEMDETLGRLYEFGVESLNDLRDRLARCEHALEKIESSGLMEVLRESRKG